jgi:hypothetical protein
VKKSKAKKVKKSRGSRKSKVELRLQGVLKSLDLGKPDTGARCRGHVSASDIRALRDYLKLKEHLEKKVFPKIDPGEFGAGPTMTILLSRIVDLTKRVERLEKGRQRRNKERCGPCPFTRRYGKTA